MIVYLNCRTFEYDVHSLVKAFFVDEDVEINDNLPLTAATDKADLLYALNGSMDSKRDVFDENNGNTERYISVVVYPRLVPGPDENTMYSGRIEASYFDIAPESCIKVDKTADNVVRSELKNIVKRTLYELLCRVQKRTLPWGTLTGIRPTKIPMSLLCEGADDAAIREYMQHTYLCSLEKITLATDIARRENMILAKVDRNNPTAGKSVDCKNDSDKNCEGNEKTAHDKTGYSLYVGVPFCPTRCLYCSFTSYPIISYQKKVKEYLACVRKELSYTAEQFCGQNPDTVYVGGGTPTALSAEELDVLLNYIDEFFDVSKLLEFTVEAGRPDSITSEKLSVLKAHGVTRISVNPQTMNQGTLDLIGRRHSVEDVVMAFNMARSAGFDNINMDIILGLPGENEDMVRHTLSEIEKLAPDSLTVHSMAIKRAAGMHQFLMEHPDIESKNTDRMMELTSECAAKLNLKPYYLYRQKNMAGNYENVGYAREGCYGLYNILIMEEVQTIIACGAGTVTKRVYGDGRIERCDTVKDVNLYIDKIDEMIERKRKLMSM